MKEMYWVIVVQVLSRSRAVFMKGRRTILMNLMVMHFHYGHFLMMNYLFCFSDL